MRASWDPQRFTYNCIIDRLLNWVDEARSNGRELRAEYLIGLAWVAYDEGCINGFDTITFAPAVLPHLI